MKKMLLAVVLCFGVGIVFAEDPMPTPTPTPTPPLSSITNQFETSFLSHISAVESFRQDGSHVIKFTDGIFQMMPYRGDHLLLASFGLIPNPTDSTKFYKDYSIHLHLFSLVGKYLLINPSYAQLLNDIEATPGYGYSTDVHHGQFDFAIGYAHKFGQ